LIPQHCRVNLGAMAEINFTPEQIKIAAKLDAKVSRFLVDGCDDITILTEMSDDMLDFKRLMDTSSQGELDALCRRYGALYHYAKVLEGIAEAIASGRLVVPK
jgi:hypothetical protein